MACNLDSRLGQLEEQGKTMVDATRKLLEIVNAVKDTGELLLQMRRQKIGILGKACMSGLTEKRRYIYTIC